MVIPVVTRALGAMPNTLTSRLPSIPGDLNEKDLQKSALLGTAQYTKTPTVLVDTSSLGNIIRHSEGQRIFFI